MTHLNNISTGTSQSGARIVISGVEKVGKTTLACDAPRALLIPMEIGYASMRCAKIPQITSYDDLMAVVEDIERSAQAGMFPYHSLIFDSATSFERLIHDHVLRSDPAWQKKNVKGLTMESALGGYGKAYQFANELFERFTKRCDNLAIYGRINIVLTCHVFAAKVIDPAYGEYDTWDLLLHSPKNQKSYGKRELITQWADLIGFLHEPLYVTKAGEGEKMNRAISANQGRVLAVDRTPGYVAGNRYGMTGTIPIPATQGWNALAHQVYTCSGVDIFNRD